MLSDEVEQLRASNAELINGNTALQADLTQMQQQFVGTNTGDFDRDPNQGSLELGDLNQNAPEAIKEKRFLLSELKQIKE